MSLNNITGVFLTAMATRLFMSTFPGTYGKPYLELLKILLQHQSN